MEWVETTGRSIEEAKEAALDRLGVHEDDAEFEVLEDAKLGLFGRVRSEARVRARVRPARPRAKDEGRERRRRSQNRRRKDGVSEREPAGGGGDVAAAADDQRNGARSEADVPSTTGAGAGVATGGGNGRRRGGARGRSRSAPAGGSPSEAGTAAPVAKGTSGLGTGSATVETAEGTEVDVPLATQADEAKNFLEGLIDRFGMDGDIAIAEIDEQTVELQVTGEDLGLLIGPKGQTLQAIQELTRSAVQRRTGSSQGRLMVDIAGYRQKRRQALETFTRQQVERVLQSQTRLVLEPMSAADRKVVHDTVNTIDGVITASEGEEPRRRVVIMPAGD